MTRNDLRAQCIEAMAIPILRYDGGFGWNEELGAHDIGSEEWARDYLAYAKTKPPCKCGDCPKCRVDEALAKSTAAFDSLHGIVFVDPIEATVEMIIAGREAVVRSRAGEASIESYRAMAATGDLTNPPEKKPC